MRTMPLCLLTLAGCGILTPDDGIDYEWSVLGSSNAGEEFEVVEIDREIDWVTMTGTCTLFSGVMISSLNMTS